MTPEEVKKIQARIQPSTSFMEEGMAGPEVETKKSKWTLELIEEKKPPG
jgi:hypothetical protein